MVGRTEDSRPDSVAQMKSLAERYRSNVQRSNRGHYQAAEYFERKQRFFGVGTAVAAAVLGTSIFATINESPTTAWRIAAGLLALLASLLATLETTLKHSNRASDHRSAGAAYGRLRRQFDLLMLDLDGGADFTPIRERLERLVTEIDNLGEVSPLIPPRNDPGPSGNPGSN